MTPRWKRCALGLSSLFVCALFPNSAHAESIQVLFVAREVTPFSARVRAEIEGMGFSLVSSDELDAQGHSTAKAAAVVVEIPPPRRVELWLKNPNNGRLELSTVLESPQSSGSPGDEAAETVRASEQLRAFFQPLQPKEAPVVSPVPAVPAPLPVVTKPVVAPQRAAPAAPVEREPARLFEELALAVPIEPGSLGIDALVRGGYWFHPRWGLGAKLVIPLLPSTVHSGVNSADVSLALGGAELSLLVVRAHALRLLTRAGLALAWLRATGEASAPYTSGSDNALAALPSLATQAEFSVSTRVRVSFGAEIGLTVPKLEVVFASQPVAHWARPFGLLSAGVSFDL